MTSLNSLQVGNQAWASWVDDNLSDLTRINNKVGRLLENSPIFPDRAPGRPSTYFARTVYGLRGQ
jgi:hypothetical protein